MKSITRYITLLLVAILVLPCAAQEVTNDTVAPAATSRRHITPVKPETNIVLLPGKDVDEKLIEQYISGDTAKIREEARRDSLSKVYTRYPKITDVTVGLNFIDMVLAAAGQDYMNADLNCTLNMWNRLQPVLELGVGRAKSTPDDKNYTYIGKISPYARIGANYNLMFKSSPDYQALLGVRLGGSAFKYDVTDIQHHNGYWNESATTAITGVSGRALWFEAVAGLKVKIWRQFSLGWQIKFHKLLSENKAEQGKPWFIPGYGTRSGSIAYSFNAYYTLPLYKRVEENEKSSIADVK